MQWYPIYLNRYVSNVKTMRHLMGPPIYYHDHLKLSLTYDAISMSNIV